MRRFTIAVATAVFTIGLAQVASAADLPRKAPAYVPPLPPPQDWSGIYVGLEGGYGWGHQENGTVPFLLNGENAQCFGKGCPVNFGDFQEFQTILHDNKTAADVLLGHTKQRGWLFGGFFGAQKQWGSWVLGLEGDIDAADIKGSVAGSSSVQVATLSEAEDSGPLSTVTKHELLDLEHSVSLDSKIDMLASLRGKVGFVPAPDWLIYGTGGAAFAHVKNSLSDSQSLAFGDECTGFVIGSMGCDFALFANNTFTASANDSMFGWAAGAGVDWKHPIDAGSAWVLGVEYLHYGFPSQTVTFSGPNGGSFSFTGKENVDTIKGRISYLFSIH